MIKEKAEEKNEYLSFNRDEVIAMRETYFHLWSLLRKIPKSKKKRDEYNKMNLYLESMLKKFYSFLGTESEDM